MAEILLSLTIIGVVAAITLPSLTGNINERTWNTQRKALYARMSQAISLMPALNGYGTITAATDSASAVDTATETFITDGLAKVMKINNICSDNFQDCGVPASYTDMLTSKKALPTTLYGLSSWFRSAAFSGSSYTTSNTKAAAFETQNGESIVAYYNRSCRTEYLNHEFLTQRDNAFGFPQATMCVNFIYDLNGTKGPNTVGKDIGIITVFNSIDSDVVAPMPSSAYDAKFNDSDTIRWRDIAKACANADSESRAPNVDELSAMLINSDIVNLTMSVNTWSSSVYNSDRAWNVSSANGARHSGLKSHTHHLRCIKR